MNAKAMITAAACEIFREFPPEKVTVEQIIQRADVSRATFYRYFRDKYDVLEYYCTETVRLATEDIDSHQVPIYTLHRITYENRNMYRIMFNRDPARVLEKTIAKNIYQRMLRLCEEKFGQPITAEHDATARFLAAGMTSLLRDWCIGKFEMSLDEFSRVSARIFETLLPMEQN